MESASLDPVLCGLQFSGGRSPSYIGPDVADDVRVYTFFVAGRKPQW